MYLKIYMDVNVCVSMYIIHNVCVSRCIYMLVHMILF